MFYNLGKGPLWIVVASIIAGGFGGVLFAEYADDHSDFLRSLSWLYVSIRWGAGLFLVGIVFVWARNVFKS